MNSPGNGRDMSEIFSERALHTINEAAEAAVLRKVMNVDTEHFLYALASGGDVMDKIFKTLGLDTAELANQLETQMEEGTYEGSSPSLTPRAKQVLQLAIYEAQELGHNYVGSEHIFLGLVREGEGLAAQILHKLGIAHPKARQAVVKVIGEGDESGEKVKDTSDTPTLDKYGKDLTQLAKKDKIDPVVGRADEITRVIEILSRRRKNNPVLIGEPGVGKTAIAEGLAQRIATDNVPDVLTNKRLIALDISALLAGSKFRGEFEERAKKVLDELEKSRRDIILFIDELHTIVGTGAQEGQMDLSNMLKPPLARGDVQLIGATTLSEYKKYIEKDSALERRFQPVLVNEPSVEETISILRGLRDRYEGHHRIGIKDEALVAAAELSDRYVTDRFLPDKAIDIIDEAASRVKLLTTSEPEELRQKKMEIKKIEAERESLSRAGKHKEAAELKVKIDELQEKIAPIEEDWNKRKGTGTPEVDIADITEVVSRISGVPTEQLKQEEKEKLIHLEEELHKRIVGQEEAVQAVSQAVRRSRVGLSNPDRPIGSFLFLGPTGVGKTELARALAETVFGDEEAMIRLDMSEYIEQHSVARLIGSPPGYVGYDEGGQLTEKVRRNPYSVILLDELEKAHPDVFNSLLQILEDGRMTDGKGRTVNFKNTIIIATSNIGSEKILNFIGSSTAKPANTKSKDDSEKMIKFKDSDDDKDKDSQSWDDLKDDVLEVLKKMFRPEFLNRIDEIIVFKALSDKQLSSIVRLLLERTKLLLNSQKISIDIDDAAINQLVAQGYDPQYGARPIRRTIQREIENPLSNKLIAGDLQQGDSITISFNGSKFVFEKQNQ